MGTISFGDDMTPDQIAKTGSEHMEQAALMAYCATAAQYGFAWADDDRAYMLKTRAAMYQESQPVPVPALARLFAIHNQGHGDRIRGAKAKAEGVKAGVPDMMLPIPRVGFHGLFIELKKQSGGKVSDEQKEWIVALDGQGYSVQVAYGWRHAVDILKDYLKDR